MKVRAYARIGVRHGWYVDPERRELTVYELCGGEWNVVHVYGEGELVRARPFDGMGVESATLWMSEEPT